jgi:hypothetical protein
MKLGKNRDKELFEEVCKCDNLRYVTGSILVVHGGIGP